MLSTINRQSLLHQAANDFGYDSIDKMIEASICDSVVPGVCECGYSCDIEPDGDFTCPECGGKGLSILLLAGII